VRHQVLFHARLLSPNVRTPNHGFNQGFTPPPPFYITNAGGESRVKPGVWRHEMWALVSVLRQAEFLLKGHGLPRQECPLREG
jgi:hypothetical protein